MPSTASAALPVDEVAEAWYATLSAHSELGVAGGRRGDGAGGGDVRAGGGAESEGKDGGDSGTAIRFIVQIEYPYGASKRL